MTPIDHTAPMAGQARTRTAPVATRRGACCRRFVVVALAVVLVTAGSVSAPRARALGGTLGGASGSGAEGILDPASCFSEEAAADPLGTPSCLKSLGRPKAGTAASSLQQSPDPMSCTGTPHSDRCPMWAGTYDQGYDASPKDQVLSPTGDRAFISMHDYWERGRGGASVVAIAQATGQQLWAVPVVDPGGDRAVPAGMAVSPDGTKLYVTGASSAIDSGSDFFTLAYDAATGQRLWSSRYTGIEDEGPDAASAIAVSGDGTTLYVTGSSSNGRGVQSHNFNYDIATVAYSALSGQQLWVARHGTADGSEQPMALGVDSSNSRLFVTGFSDGSGSQDLVTVAYKAATGLELWNSLHGDDGWDIPGSLGVATDGSRVFVSGFSMGGAAGSRATTLAYDAGTGTKEWDSGYSTVEGWLTGGLAVSPDGRRVYAGSTSYGSLLDGQYDYVTIAHDALSGKQEWTARYDNGAHDFAGDLAVSPDSSRVYVTGSSARYHDFCGCFNDDATTIAYDAYDSAAGLGGRQVWVGRYNGLPQPSGHDGVRVDVSSDAKRVLVSAAASRVLSQGSSRVLSQGVEALAYDADAPGPVAPAVPPAPMIRDGAAEGNFSLMSFAHTLASAAGVPRPWNAEIGGEGFRYNSNTCTEPSGPNASATNNIATNLTTYNTLIPGSSSPASIRSHPFEFDANTDGEGASHLKGRITLVACNLTGGATVGPPDALRDRIFIEFDATAHKSSAQEAPFEGTFTIKGGTGGIYEEISGQGRIHGYLFCFIPGNTTAGGCAGTEGSPFTDVHYTLTGWYRDPSVPGAPDMALPPIQPVDVVPPPSGGPGVVAGPFSLMAMIHNGRWDGASRTTPLRDDSYSTLPCSGNAPVNNLSTNLSTYNSRLPGSASPASTRTQPLVFAISPGDHPRQRKLSGRITLDVCHRQGGASFLAPEKIYIDVAATTERVSTREVRFEGSFDIVGGTGVYEDLSGSGRIHGYLMCFRFMTDPMGKEGGDCFGQRYRDGQYTLNGWYSDPTVAELGVGPTKVSITEDSPRSGQFSDQVTPRASLQDSEGKPMADAAVDFELAGAGGTRSWTATTDAQGVAGVPVTLDLTPGAYDLSVRYAGSEKRGPSSDLVAFTITKEATATALSVEGQAPRRTLRAKVADDDGQLLVGVVVQFSAGGKPIGTATTDVNGEATLVVPSRYQGGPHRFGAAFAGDERYLASSGAATT